MKKGTILIVDDHSLSRRILATSLGAQNYEVHEVENGRLALEWLEENPVDLILLDLVMPGMDGFKVLESIKANQRLRHIPVIVISSLPEMANTIRAIEMGAADYITKPIDAALLKARVGSSLALKRLYDLEKANQEELRKQKDTFQKLFTVSQVVSQSLSLEDTLSNALTASITISQAEMGTLWLIDRDKNITPYLIDDDGRPAVDSGPGSDKNFQNNLAKWVLDHQKPALIKNIRKDERWVEWEEQDAYANMLSVICLPISFKAQELGILILMHSREDFFKDEALDLLLAAADQLAMTLYNSRLYEEQRKLYESLEISEDRYRDLFENARELIQGVGQDGRFQYVNSHWEHVLGYSAEEARGMRFEAILHPDELTHCRQLFSLLQEGKTINQMETRFITLDGEIIHVEGNLSVRTDETGKFVTTRGIFRDVTNRKMAEEALENSLKRTNALYRVAQAISKIESMAELMQTVVDSIASTLPADRVALIHLDTERQEIINFVRGGPGADYIHLVTYEELQEGLTGWVLRENKAALSSKLQSDHRESQAVQRRRKEAYTGSIIVVPFEYRDRTLGTITAINRLDQPDFTEQDVALMTAMAPQIAVSFENARLYEVEQQRSRELAEYVEELDMFAGAVAHDLKSPLTAVNGYARLIQEVNEDEKSLRYAAMIQFAGNKMDDIVDNLLLLARVRTSSVPITAVDVRNSLIEAVKRLEHFIEENEAKILWDDGDWPQALAYSGWLEEVWANYINNAIKYGGTPPIVELAAEPLQDGCVRYWVRDNGQGMTEEEQSKLFAQFERLDNVDILGHGLGLAIVKRIVEKLNGRVGVESIPGQGSTFYFDLPAA